MNAMLDMKWKPINSTIGFIETDHEAAADFFLRWHKGLKGWASDYRESRLSGDLAKLFGALLPLVSVVRSKYLFVPTRSHWTAFFDNGWRGTDAFAPISYMAQELGCRGLRATATSDAIILEIYGPQKTHFLNYVLSVAVAKEDGRWNFSRNGESQTFEQTERYKARNIQDRFTLDMLRDYLADFGIAAFDETYYLPPDREAILIEALGPLPKGARTYSLEEVRYK